MFVKLSDYFINLDQVTDVFVIPTGLLVCFACQDEGGNQYTRKIEGDSANILLRFLNHIKVNGKDEL